ncbi:hypothetical protein RHMOL_Rhmol05G0004000 [Rhododendron molle]|uniref:Uncharacterized protein n=1 Tax=Rhododendron molle TaxID=49168 RepID=A0ACC0NIX3_RHOML|nr:hypothetical protein RHMOL_Rhmol05G0004000 [Rhododendron molle]
MLRTQLSSTTPDAVVIRCTLVHALNGSGCSCVQSCGRDSRVVEFLNKAKDFATISDLWGRRQRFGYEAEGPPTNQNPAVVGYISRRHRWFGSTRLRIRLSSHLIYLFQMKIFSWMQSKLNGKQGTKKPNSKSDNDQTLQEPCKEEFSDWPRGLLAIGTFGNKSLEGDPERCNLQGGQSSSQGQPLDITPEEAVELQKELMLFHTQVSNESNAAEDLENLQLEMLTFTPSLEDESSKCNTVCGASAGQSGQLQRSTSLKGKDICVDHTKKSMRKKALSFLLKKMGISQSMFAPTPSLRDPIPDKSTMEKILRAILHKKVYPQKSSTKATTKKYIDNSHMHKPDEEDGTNDTANDGSKWVKTDSECKILFCRYCSRDMICLASTLFLEAGMKMVQSMFFLETVKLKECYESLSLELFWFLRLFGLKFVNLNLKDLDKEELPLHMIRVSAPEIERAQKAEREAADLRGSMRKRMEFLDID